MRVKLLFLLLVLLIGTVQGVKCVTTGMCRGRVLEVKYEHNNSEKCYERAEANFGRYCGGLTKCDSECEDTPKNRLEIVPARASPCCREWCQGLPDDSPALGKCLYACEASCNQKEIITLLVNSILLIAGAFAALVLAYHGIRLVTSGDPFARREAKNSIKYAFIALVLLGIASLLVNLLFAPFQVPGGETYLSTETILP